MKTFSWKFYFFLEGFLSVSENFTINFPSLQKNIELSLSCLFHFSFSYIFNASSFKFHIHRNCLLFFCAFLYFFLLMFIFLSFKNFPSKNLCVFYCKKKKEWELIFFMVATWTFVMHTQLSEKYLSFPSTISSLPL
jgi:hypothetical protein